MEKYDVVALGELLIDLTQNGYSGQGNPLLEANPGGAPCNVLALLTKLGHSTAFIGKVGKDGFGDQLEKALTESGVPHQRTVYNNAAHGIGLGYGTDAEGWLDAAAAFWEAQTAE